MGFGGFNTRQLHGEYRPAWGPGIQYAWLVTVTGAATRLGQLLITAGSTFPFGIPQIPDDVGGPERVLNRAPTHVIFQVPTTNTGRVFLTWDNNTNPVVGGPGIELVPGSVYQYELDGTTLLVPKLADPVTKGGGGYPVNNQSAFLFIASVNTPMSVTFSD